MDIALTQRLSFKQARLTVLVAFILGTALSFIQVAIDYASEDAGINREINALLDISHNPAARIAYNIDAELAQELVLGLLRSPAVIRAEISDANQIALARVSRPAQSSRYRAISDYLFGERRYFATPLYVSHAPQEALGKLSLEVDTYVFGNHFLRRATLTLITGFTRSLLLSMILLVMFYFMLTKPLTRVIRAISERDPRSPDNAKLAYPEGHKKDEIGVLVDVTNRQLTSIANEIAQRQQAEARLTRYLTELEDMISARTEQLEATNNRLQVSNRELEEAKRVAVDMAQARSAFLANMSHEIRTPLNGLLGMLALSLDGPLNNEQRQQLSIAHNSGKVLVELLNDILDLSKFEAGQLELESIPFDLANVVEETASLLSQNTAPGVELTCLIDPQLPNLVLGDPKRVRQIVSNLLSNALKFTRLGRVDIYLNKTEQGVRIIVRDTGIGIAAEAQSRIFQRFTQAGVDITRQYGGTGLGLALTRRLCEAMHGHLRLETEEDVGSTFYADLPLPGQPSVQTQPNLRGHVLVLSPTQSGLSAQLANLLPYWGLSYEHLPSGSDPSQRPADLIICDELARVDELRATCQLPILLVSSYGNFISSEQVERFAPIEQLARPLSRLALLQALRRSLGQGPASNTSTPHDHSRSRQARVLLVEDNPVNQLVAKGMLHKLGYQIFLANHGAEALQLLERQPVDIVLMDCNMPIMDGYETTRQIRRTPALANLPIIALTANALSDERERCQAAGMNDYLAKPFRKDELAALLDQWLAWSS
ncbi:response regulator [Pseudomonas sp. 5P_3.1_Bac2]|uniref:response regulator n=1 Tax=Pseudomonas sp. 5P_3.1_Bac2 TaxID=2971617 RepID=UPI0021C93906|nr:response regulator [Pseudomonas sp. 5P_3.1_Bac2]MCU1716147.1 response regulator [Pseudomonas sp. 5P_3.1_Bac2]